MADNYVKINDREAHFIGVSKIQLGNKIFYNLSEQKHRPWFVLVLDRGQRAKKDK